MHQVKRAIIMAAGCGTRMRPVTCSIPKPLVQVGKTKMIHTVIRGLRDNGIMEIYIVVGYLKEQFYYLEQQFPGVKLIENPDYAASNNISSLYAAREHLCDSIILDGDQIIYNSRVLHKNFERSGYNAVWTQEECNEWMLTVRDQKITACSKNGGAPGWRLYSISRWTQEDGLRLKKHVEIEYGQKRNRMIYWDDLVLFCYPKEYELGICKMNLSDVLEIDSLEELARIDASYRKYCSGCGQ